MDKQLQLNYVLNRMKEVNDDDRYSLMCEWCEVIFDDTFDTFTIPQHIRLQEN